MSTLLVASTGGHLAELYYLRSRFDGVDSDVVWVTFDNPQSRALLAGEEVIHVEFTSSREYRHVASNARAGARILQHPDITGVVSTGAGIALSFLPLARARGISCHYIESAARSSGPSTTGRLLRYVPGMALYTQNRSWEDNHWRYRGSVFDDFAPGEARRAPPAIRSVVVLLGSHPMYGFRRLLERLVEIMPAGAEVLWQTGGTDASGLGIDATPWVPPTQLNAALRGADLVVSHAGVGSALSALAAGRSPVLVPRSGALGEHVDDHQLEIAAGLAGRNVAAVRRVDDLRPEDLAAAAARTVIRVPNSPRFRLSGGRPLARWPRRS